MAVINYDDTAFRALFPAYSNATTYPLATLQGYWNTAICYVSNCPSWLTTLARQTLAINQMTAHLVYIAGIIAGGNIPSMVNAATIDKISVTLQPPPFGSSEFKWWLGLSPYGQQLAALLSVIGVGGLYATTAPGGRAGFRFGGVC